MNRKWAVLILLAACMIVAGAKKEKDKEKGKDKAKSDGTANTETVTIKGQQFSPSQVTIAKGDTVEWINKDDHDHTVQADDGSFNSGNIRSGQKFEHQFKKSGTFSYSCKYHPREKGTITVK